MVSWKHTKTSTVDGVLKTHKDCYSGWCHENTKKPLQWMVSWKHTKTATVDGVLKTHKDRYSGWYPETTQRPLQWTENTQRPLQWMVSWKHTQIFTVDSIMYTCTHTWTHMHTHTHTHTHMASTLTCLPDTVIIYAHTCIQHTRRCTNTHTHTHAHTHTHTCMHTHKHPHPHGEDFNMSPWCCQSETRYNYCPSVRELCKTKWVICWQSHLSVLLTSLSRYLRCVEACGLES